jgi:hypothetical protein
MKPKSDNLFHFTKSLDVLKLILKNGIYPRYCLEDIEWFGVDDKYLAFPMSCFCDIPLSRISEHTNFYGNYGLGMCKEWGAKNKLNPVVYSPPGGSVQLLTKYLFHLDIDGCNSIQRDEVDNQTYKLWSLLKPTIGNMVVSGSVIEKEFYQENEWRYVPPVTTVIEECDFEDEKEQSNEEIEKYKLEISPSDIRYIFVKNDSDIPELVDFINTDLDVFPLNEIKILLSRIVSLDTLQQDL